MQQKSSQREQKSVDKFLIKKYDVLIKKNEGGETKWLNRLH